MSEECCVVSVEDFTFEFFELGLSLDIALQYPLLADDFRDRRIGVEDLIIFGSFDSTGARRPVSRGRSIRIDNDMGLVMSDDIYLANIPPLDAGQPFVLTFAK